LRAVVTLLLAGLLVALVAPVVAQDTASRGAMLIILDASGSMNDADEDGVPFIDKAKAAVVELVDALPDDLDVGLRVYGHREPNTDPVRGCLDTELVAPVAPLDRDAIRTAVEGIDASGYTPIGLSLQQAADDLPEAGPRSIVLISDGVDTCAPPDPCEVAAELYGDAIDVRIESIGFLIDTGSAAEQQLRCIAESSGGEYRTVGRADELIGRLGEVATDVLDWRPPMTLNGALEPAVAPLVPVILTPDWLAEVPPTFARSDYVGVIMPGETRWFQVDTWNGESFWAFAELAWPPGTEATGAFEAFVVDPSGNPAEAPTVDMPMRVSLEGADSVDVGVQNANPPQGGPFLGGRYLLGFHWDAPDDVFLGSLRVKVDILGDDRDAGRAVVEGSLDPDSAPVLELASMSENGPNWKGNGYFGPIDAGETRWYRIDTDPGEVVNAFAVFPAYRSVGTGLDGVFSVEMRDLDGASVGAAFREVPQLSESFGDDPHQASVSISTELEPTLPADGVLVGFTWDGTEGDSQIRFHVETDYDASRHHATNEPEPEAEPGTPPPEAEAAQASTETAGGSGTNMSTILIVALALAATAGLTTFVSWKRRSHR